MNAAVANLILARIEAANLPWVDKTAGLTRAISFGANTSRPGTWPIACTVNDPLACDSSTIAELLPDERYNSILFFEGDTFPSKQRSRQIPGLVELASKLRVVVWLNCSRLGGDCDCGSLAAQNLIGAIESPRRRYASGPLIDIQHTVIGGGPARGREIFSRYTFNEDRSQYLHFPFDFFAIDIETTYRIAPGCEDQVEQDNVNCWTGPEMIRRRHPKDFTCEELQDATNGLTEEQLGPECLNCSGDECDTLCEQLADPAVDVIAAVDCIANGNIPEWVQVLIDQDEATPEVIVVGIEGAGKADAVKDILCDPCPTCDDATVSVNGTEYDQVAAGGSLNIPVVNSDATPVGGVTPGVSVQIGNSRVFATDGVTEVTAIPAEDHASLGQSVIKYTDAAGGAQITAPSNTEFAAATLRPSTVVPRRQVLNTAGNPANATYADLDDLIAGTLPVAQNGTVTINNSVPTLLHSVAVASNGAATQAIADSTITKPDGTTVGLPATVALDVRDYRSGIAYQFGKQLWSGQITQYRAGDEGALNTAGWFDYTRPVYPTHYAELGADFYTLAANNVHGNTLRFTDRTGAAAATSGNRVIQDHLTGIEWYRPGTMFTAATWISAIDAAVASTVESSSDWWLPPVEVLWSIADLGLAEVFNHGGFLITSALWSSTTVPFATANAVRLIGASSVGPAQGVVKTSTNPYIYCRRFI